MRALYRKELSSYFYTLNGYICIFLVLLFSGIFFTILNISEQSGNFDSTASMISYIFLLAVPIITMKSYASQNENQKSHISMILPVNPLKVALAKYFSLLTVYTIPFVFIALYPIFISVNGGGDLAWSECSLLGLFLFGAFLISIGMFISSLSPNQTVSAIITFAVLFVQYLYQTIRIAIPYDSFTNFIIIISAILLLGWVIYVYSRHIPTAVLFSAVSVISIAVVYLIDSSIFYGSVYNIITFLSVSSGFYTFSSGIFSVQGIVFYISFTALFILLTSILPQNKGFNTKNALPEHKKSISKSNKNVSAYYSAVCIFCMIAVIGINLVLTALPSSSVNYDVTANRYHSVSKDGEKILNKLKSPITIYHISSKDSDNESLSLWLDNIAKEKELITVIYVDSDIHPSFYKPFTDTALSDNSIIVTGEKSSAIIRNEDMYLYGITFMNNQISEELNYDSALQTYNAYIDAYLEDYGIDVSSYISYYPTHLVRERALISAISSCGDISSPYISTDSIKPVSIVPPEPVFSEAKKTVFSILFSFIIPALPLIAGTAIINIRRSKVD